MLGSSLSVRRIVFLSFSILLLASGRIIGVDIAFHCSGFLPRSFLLPLLVLVDFKDGERWGLVPRS